MLRRVVTGHRQGKAAFLADGVPPRTQIFKTIPGMATSLIWSTVMGQQIVQDDPADAVSPGTTLLPLPGETRFIYLRVAPDSVATSADFDPAAAGREMVDLQPEMAALMEPDHPGMHRTDTVDYVIVLEGEIFLEVDDGEEVRLGRHDTVIQTGARHAWHNRSDSPVLLAVILIGAQRG